PPLRTFIRRQGFSTHQSNPKIRQFYEFYTTILRFRLRHASTSLPGQLKLRYTSTPAWVMRSIASRSC
ncbi:MAG: hypothetical protein JXR63_10060, partial [Spirochaetales bacterium]|nr:hypothetical protein [Spirochaetales bacterium]